MNKSSLKDLLESYNGYKEPRSIITALLHQMSNIKHHASAIDKNQGSCFSKRASVAYDRLVTDSRAMEILDDQELAERLFLLLSYCTCRKVLKDFIYKCL